MSEQHLRALRSIIDSSLAVLSASRRHGVQTQCKGVVSDTGLLTISSGELPARRLTSAAGCCSSWRSRLASKKSLGPRALNNKLQV